MNIRDYPLLHLETNSPERNVEWLKGKWKNTQMARK
jgi:hypothetical protein